MGIQLHRKLLNIRWITLICTLSITLVADADSEVLHEYVPNVDPNEAAMAISQYSDIGPGFLYNGQFIPPPADAPPGEGEQPMQSSAGVGSVLDDPGARSPAFRPDRTTDFKGSVSYYGTFNPAIAPFKRVTSLGMVSLASDGKTPVLGVSTTRRRMVAIEGADSTPPDARLRDRFWANVLLDFSRGRVVPLPSVSPESRILVANTTPYVELQFEKDGDDNYFAVAKGALHVRKVRLRFLTDAPRGYFGSEIPQIPATVLQEEVAPLQRSIQRRAELFARELGLRRTDDLKRVINTLTEHFRSFEESEIPPEDTGDIYLDLARGKKGVCRHRAYAFVITAQALGIPARYQQNEAHAWVEVKIPEGWMRIDLGGAVQRVQTHAVHDRPIYKPLRPDSLPRPAQYEKSYQQAEKVQRDTSSVSESDLVGRWLSPSARGSKGASNAPRVILPGDLTGTESTDHSGRQRPTVTMDHRFFKVLRGQSLKVSGRIEDSSGSGLKDLEVQVSLAIQDGTANLFLGFTHTGADGRFDAEFDLPSDVPVGDYTLAVITPGNDSFLPAMAR